MKIQVGELESSTMDYQLNLNSRASDLLAQFYRQFLRSPENGKGKMRRYDITILKKNVFNASSCVAQICLLIHVIS